MAKDKRDNKNKKKKSSPMPKKASSANKKKTTGSAGKKIKKSSSRSGIKAGAAKNKPIKRTALKRFFKSPNENIFEKTLPDWIISSHSRKNAKGKINKKLYVFAVLTTFLIVFFVIKTYVFKPDDRINISDARNVSEQKKPLLLKTDRKKQVPASKALIKPVVAKPAVSEGSMPSSITEPYLVFVIDDVGNTTKDKQLLIDLGDNVTYAILPFLPHTELFADISRKTKAEVILHLPIESNKGQEKDPGKISPEMTRDQITDQLNKDFASVPYCIGANNHKGSLGTSDVRLMRIILSEIRARGFFFLDSYTTSDSVVSSISRQLGLPVLKRDIFLDNIDSPDRIDAQISKLSAIARKKGHAIGIGHYRTNTLKVLNKRIPALKEQGYTVISLKRLIEITR